MFLRAAALVGALALAASHAGAQSPEPPTFAPYVGGGGFQEIELGGDAWYVAFHGVRQNTMAAVEAAWLARSAQLCLAGNKRFLVELRYVGEHVLSSEPMAHLPSDVSGYAQHVAGVVYIPIVISSRPQQFSPIITPTKMAAIRCLSTVTGLRADKVAVDAQAALHAARSAGLVIP